MQKWGVFPLPPYEYAKELQEKASEEKKKAVWVHKSSTVAVRGALADRQHISSPRTDKEESYNIVLVPVGYSEEEALPQMRRLFTVLNSAYRDVPGVSFSYLNKSVPVSIGRKSSGLDHGFITNLDEISALVSFLGRYMSVHGIHLVINDPLLYGVYVALDVMPVSFSSGERSASYFAAIHEIGHHLFLSDGYRRGYGPLGKEGYDSFGINSTELLTNTTTLRPDVMTAYEKFQPDLVEVGTFYGEPVYLFKDNPGVANVMRENGATLPNDTVRELLAGNTPLFSEFQLWIMNNYIKETLSTPNE